MHNSTTPEHDHDSSGNTRLARVLVSLVALTVAGFIAAESHLLNAAPGLQLFQAIMILGLWALVMFGGTSDFLNGRR